MKKQSQLPKINSDKVWALAESIPPRALFIIMIGIILMIMYLAAVVFNTEELKKPQWKEKERWSLIHMEAINKTKMFIGEIFDRQTRRTYVIVGNDGIITGISEITERNKRQIK